jgi:putative oxidoreductase
MSFGIALLRAVVGGLFIGHGLQKLLGKFGGDGLEGTAGLFETLGLRPGKVHAAAAGSAETGGGALLAAGAATPLAASALTGTMTVAIAKVHGRNGVWAQQGGYEYPLVMMAALFAITASGPGALALDRRQWGPAWAMAALAAGVGGGMAMVKLGERFPEPEAATGRFTREPSESTARSTPAPAEHSPA